MSEIAFSLGSNLGDRRALLSEAARRLLAYPGAGLLARSRLYETEPVGVKPEHRDQCFLNSVLVISTEDVAATWLERLAEVEQALGRVRGDDRYAPRKMDIDILYRGQDLIGSGGLTVPHPRWTERRFVLAPLAEVRPDLVLPGQDRSVSEILAALPPGEAVYPLSDPW